jgi:putative transposase
MILCHKIRLKTNKPQEEYLRGCSGINRLTWNWITDKFKNTEKGFNTLNLKKEFNRIKHETYPFLSNYPKDCNQETFSDFNKTIQQFFKKRKGFPKFKSIHNNRRSFSLSNDKFTIKSNKLCFKKFKFTLTESIRFDGKIKSLRIIEESTDKWFACFFIELRKIEQLIVKSVLI